MYYYLQNAKWKGENLLKPRVFKFEIGRFKFEILVIFRNNHKELIYRVLVLILQRKIPNITRAVMLNDLEHAYSSDA